MRKNQQENQSIENIIEQVKSGKLLLPEFQRDFKWPIEKTEILFDSIFRELFIGSLIISKPKFDLACKGFDLRPRGSRGHKPKPKEWKSREFEEQNIYTLLDGQQRVTSIFRALIGVDNIYVIFKDFNTLSSEEYYDKQNGEVKKRFKDYIEGFDTKPSKHSMYVTIAELYKYSDSRDKKFLEEIFAPIVLQLPIDEENKDVAEDFLLTLKNDFRSDILKKDSLLSVQLLDMDLESFCLYFERSNAQGMTLSFTDIINAKVYIDFKLFREIKVAKDQSLYFRDKLIDPIVRYINYLANNEVTKKSILSDLRGSHFNKYWEGAIRDLDEVQKWLLQQQWIFSHEKLPYVNMLLPLLSFYQNLNGKEFSQATPEQISQLKFWFFGSILDHRYGGARHGSTNVVIKEDCDMMKGLARGQNPASSYWQKIRIDYSFDEFLKMDSINSAKALGLHFLMWNYENFKNIENDAVVVMNSSVDVHHVFPDNYLAKYFGKRSDEYDASGSILNKMRINKISNIKISDQSPKTYLNKIKESNSKVSKSLQSHFISNQTCESLIRGNLDKDYFEFLKQRYAQIEPILENIKTINEQLISGNVSNLW